MKNLTKLPFICILFLLYINVDAQNNSVYRNNYLHNQIINPATAGSEFFPVLIGTASRQWAGINNSPNQQILGGSFRIGNFDFYNPKMYVNKTDLTAYERVGLGFILYNLNEGPLTNKGGTLSYAFHIPFKHSRLSLGLATGIYSHAIDESDFAPIDPNDPILHYGKESYSRFNTNFGAYYYSANYFIGASITNMLPLSDPLLESEKIKQDFHLMGGYMINANNDINIEPSAYIGYYDFQGLQFQLNAKFYYKYVNWLNIFYHSKGDVGFKVAIKLNRFHVAYGFSTNISKIALYNYGTHGISIGTNIGIRRQENF